MVTVLREGGLRVVIFSDDHQPAHVHIFGDGETKIQLSGADARPKLIWTIGTTAAEARKAMRIAVEHQADLLRRWKDLHG